MIGREGVPSMFPPARLLSIGERLSSAEAFLKLARKELEGARAKGDQYSEREAAEKLFHALEEALTARIQKYGVPPPDSHGEIRYWLASKKDIEYEGLFRRAYLSLHVSAYYRGWVDRAEIDKCSARIQVAIEKVGRDLKRR